MGKFPVISISLKGVDAFGYATARSLMCATIGNEALRFYDALTTSKQLNPVEKKRYEALITIDTSGKEDFVMSDAVLMGSLKILCELLHKHYGQKAILLIDEYDVPLDKAFQSGYYEEMVSLIRNLLGNALKTNEHLQFAVLTGCLGISKESKQTRNEIEQLIAGKSIKKAINMELTYSELDTSIDHLWSALFTTGYLTQRGKAEGKSYHLAIPNREIRELFISQIQVWFQETTRADVPRIATT